MTYLKLAFHPLADRYELGPADPGAALSRTDLVAAGVPIPLEGRRP